MPTYKNIKLGINKKNGSIIECSAYTFDQEYTTITITANLIGERKITVPVYDFWEYLIWSGIESETPQTVMDGYCIKILLMEDLICWISRSHSDKMLCLSNFILQRAIINLSIHNAA